MSNYTPPVTSNTNYMNNWGSSSTKMTAMQIDHLSDKGKFAIDMIATALNGFDAIEKEIVEISSTVPPQLQAVLKMIAHRIDSNQKQVQDGLERMKYIMNEVKESKDILQKPNGWGF